MSSERDQDPKENRRTLRIRLQASRRRYEVTVRVRSSSEDQRVGREAAPIRKRDQAARPKEATPRSKVDAIPDLQPTCKSHERINPRVLAHLDIIGGYVRQPVNQS